jgi:hypothetical protein
MYESSHDRDLDLNGRAAFEHRRKHGDPFLRKGVGVVRRPPQLEITICDFKLTASSRLNWNMKSSGKLSMLRFTAWTKALGSTP